MGASPTSDARELRPGAISAFFVYKAGLFALGFWVWLAVLVFRGLPVSGWHILAAAGAVTTTLVGVVLGARYAIDWAAARRHDAVMRSIVELSWYSFGAPAETHSPVAPLTSPVGPATSPVGPATGPVGPALNSVDADVIELSPEVRPRQRR